MGKAKKKTGPDINEILKRNPNVDADKLRKAIELAQEMRKLGRHRAGYNLASPLTKQRALVDGSEATRRSVSL